MLKDRKKAPVRFAAALKIGAGQCCVIATGIRTLTEIGPLPWISPSIPSCSASCASVVSCAMLNESTAFWKIAVTRFSCAGRYFITDPLCMTR